MKENEKCVSISEPPDEHNQPAIYKIRWKGKKQIERLIGVDKDCILCIGKTKNIRKRISQFKRGMKTGNTGTHSEGRTLFIVNFFKENDITENDLEYTYEKMDEEEIHDGEYNAFKDYVERHGEVPPLNGCVPERARLIKEVKNKD